MPSAASRVVTIAIPAAIASSNLFRIPDATRSGHT